MVCCSKKKKTYSA